MGGGEGLEEVRGEKEGRYGGEGRGRQGRVREG